MASKPIYTVTQVNTYIKSILDGDRNLSGVYIRGEISNYKKYPSGHHYFTLKDTGGALRCVLFRSSATRLRFQPESGMKVIAYDVYENPDLKDFVTYVTLDELLAQSDLISLHCPLMDSTYHLIQLDTIKKMKDGVILVNTSRGALVKTEDLIEGIRLHKFAGVGLDVYEEETKNVFEDRSDEILEHSTTARLLSFPNVMITSHQGFFTKEALEAIAETTLQNALDFESGKKNHNQVQ